MPDFSTSFASFFKTDDVRKGNIGPLTVLSIAQEEVGQEKQLRVVMAVKEDARKIVLNKTNYEGLTEQFGSADTDKWLGKKVLLVLDPDVRFGGKKVGGISIEKA